VNTFNRIVLILLCILLVAAAVAIIFLTWTIPNRSINGLHDAVQWVDDNDGDLEKAVLTTISAGIGLISLAVLLIELLPRSGPDVKVVDVNAGDATLSTAAIGQRIEEAVCQVAHVAEVRAGVRAKKKGVLVSLDLQVDPDANLATVTDEACQTAQDVLTGRVHVQLLRPISAHLHYRELRLHGRNVERRPVSPSTPAPPSLPLEAPAPVAPEVAAEASQPSAAVAVAEAPEPVEQAEAEVSDAQPEEKPPEA
jgi:hypothetical protein